MKYIMIFLAGFYLAKADSKYGAKAGTWLAEKTKELLE